jgi:hypothetical protein
MYYLYDFNNDSNHWLPEDSKSMLSALPSWIPSNFLDSGSTTSPGHTVTGFIRAGVGHRTANGSNFLLVKQDTKLQLV